MVERDSYSPGPPTARVDKQGDQWTLVLVRDLAHPRATVWKALTDPAHLKEWAPFDSDRSLAQTGTVAHLSTVGTPTPYVTEVTVRAAEPPHRLEYAWGGNDLRWELEETAEGTRLTLWSVIDRRYIAMGAAGWHICFDVLQRWLGGHPLGRIAGGDAMKFDGWQRLHAEYIRKFGGE